MNTQKVSRAISQKLLKISQAPQVKANGNECRGARYYIRAATEGKSRYVRPE
jgi:hypothetical protein